jgi:ribosomal protein S27AE
VNKDYFQIHMGKVTPEFASCWRCAGSFLNSRGDNRISWIKAELTPPFLEHLSFRIGNQLFFIRLVDVDQNADFPGTIDGLRMISEACGGFGCLMPMKSIAGAWEVVESGWGLVDITNYKTIDPIDKISDELVEMTKWEISDFAVQVVKNYIVKELGYELMSSQSNPDVHPSIWFVGEGGPEFVIVNALLCNQDIKDLSYDLDVIAQQCSKVSSAGHLATVRLRNAEQIDNDATAVRPLFRGHAAYVEFNGLKSLAKN